VTVSKRAELLADAERRDRQADEENRKIEAGEGGCEAIATYRRLQARHLRRLAADEPVDGGE
jgi:hypothetical protein